MLTTESTKAKTSIFIEKTENPKMFYASVVFDGSSSVPSRQEPLRRISHRRGGAVSIGGERLSPRLSPALHHSDYRLNNILHNVYSHSHSYLLGIFWSSAGDVRR